jgi:hypothetical protein
MLDLVLAFFIVFFIFSIIILIIKYFLNPLVFPDKVPIKLIENFLCKKNLKFLSWSILNSVENPFLNKNRIQFDSFRIFLFKFYKIQCENNKKEKYTLFVKYSKKQTIFDKDRFYTIIKKE